MFKLGKSLKLPIILAILLYVLLYFVRWQQGEWKIKTEILKDQRIFLTEQVKKFLPSPQAQLLSGIVLGAKQDLPYELKFALRDTSTLHIVVASGQYLTILAGFIMHLSGLIKRKIAVSATLVLIIVYTLLTGAQIPILRAAVMFFLASLAQTFGRQNDGLRVLIIVAGLFLLVNPRWITDLSFQLSFLASFGVIVVAPILEKVMNFLPNIIKENLAVTLGAQLLVIPVVAANFHQLSYVSLFANVLVLWIIPYIMGVGFVFLLLGSLIPFLGQILSFALNIMLTYFIYIVEFFASLPFAWEYVGEFLWIVWVGYYLMITGILLALEKKNHTQ
ncbi:ComEC/Rec2 family competence protein [Candidatus Daviesbacteria bacterium]|nr:ComEC/Rec2 family competence protein [Candidatus Daviesbacteria bacterium]